ncbi:L-aspartate oxidase [Desulfonatronovibrio hydrogenovorans]|uniref:L-aspartate oxidase n=1 Tax=Desulfonatronovibrio hydrogenovorans TaxID=53245 RepID=UPI00048C1E36|nr:L-aspartate oxidase [Desulfonatronovibrio hydrogenovorans]
MGDTINAQVLVVGSGIAGSTAALTLAEAGLDVLLISSGEGLDSGNTPLAQGGIVYKGSDDDPRILEKDILTAGWKHNHLRAVRYLCRKGPEIVREVLLHRLKIPFATDKSGHFDLTREGGHTMARILHCTDHTGRSIMDGFLRVISDHPSIRVMTGLTAIDLLTTHHHSTELEIRYQLANQCAGAYVLEQSTGNVRKILADFTVIATGGMGQIYLNTTNTSASLGSGIVMAQRAGARMMNLEYTQFHPTALFHRGPRKFLITEAMRGEGAVLTNARGDAFMKNYDPRGDLAPRDIVTRAIVEEMLRTKEDFVYLNACRHIKNPDRRFPTIYKKCLEHNIDLTSEPIPVVPAAHYFCGGVLVDVHGKTTIDRLYAAGECACTGVHGANRLASTSLLEGLLWGHSAARDIAARFKTRSRLGRRIKASIPDWNFLGSRQNEDPVLIAQDWATIRHTMWNYVGINRTSARLKRGFEDLRNLNKRLHDFYKETAISNPLVELFHGCHAAYIITTAALRNKKSIGCHFRSND